MRIEELEREVLRHRDLYYNQSTPEISDAEYDELEAQLRDLHPDSEVLKLTGSPTEKYSQWEKVEHDFFVGSLDKAKDLDELKTWLDKYRVESFFYCSYKMDGLSIVLYYEDGIPTKAVTRGDGHKGDNIFSNVQKMEGFPGRIEGFTGSLRGEIYLKHSVFEKHFEGKANPRNAASGAAKELSGEKAHHLSLCFYSVRDSSLYEQLSPSQQFKWLEERGIATPVHDAFRALTERGFEVLLRDRAKLGYDIDGLVIWVDEPNAEEAFGFSSDNRPRAAIALKFPPDEKVGTIADIRWDFGLGGRLTPVAVLEEPLYLSGAHVQHVSLHNLDFISRHKLAIGCHVQVVRSGDVIPYITKVVDRSKAWSFRKEGGEVNNEAINLPSKCPECQVELYQEHAYLVCNNGGCKGNIRGRILKWVQSLDLKNIGEGLIRELVEAGTLNSIMDLYLLTPEDVEAVDRRSEKHYQKVKEALDAKKELTFVELMAALSIPYAGKHVWANISATGIDTLDALYEASPEDLAKADRLGLDRAKDIYKYVQQYRPLIDKLLAVGIKVKQPKVGGKLSGLSFCFTGKVDVEYEGKRATRKVLESLVEEHGGSVASVSKNLSYLVIADPSSTSSKAKKARKYGTELISPVEFLSMVS